MAPHEKPTPANVNQEYGSEKIVDDLLPLKSSICVAHMLGVKRGAPCLSSKDSATVALAPASYAFPHAALVGA